MSLSPCSITLIDYIEGDCGTPVTEDGGIVRIFAAQEDIETVITDPTDSSQWTTAINNGDVVISGKLVAEKPAPETTTATYTACSPEQVQTRTHTITGMDYHSENDSNKNFWEFVEDNATSLKFGYLLCSGKAAQWVEDCVVTKHQIIPNTKNEKIRMEFTLSFIQKHDPRFYEFPTSIL